MLRASRSLQQKRLGGELGHLARVVVVEVVEVVIRGGGGLCSDKLASPRASPTSRAALGL